ncbi:MAG TPA: hypothetical protein VHA06_04515 [Candidatus Angelobacter sp.]|nr:hypothetical protein [Candidatus Angelobacter sp.]
MQRQNQRLAQKLFGAEGLGDEHLPEQPQVIVRLLARVAVLNDVLLVLCRSKSVLPTQT